MKPTQFTIRELALSAAFVAIGCTGLGLPFRMPMKPAPWQLILATLLFYSSLIWIGVGLATPFHRKAWGALLGVGATIVAIFVFGVVVSVMNHYSSQ